MKLSDRAIPEELNWADYCDALADEVLLESQAKRMFSKPAPKIQEGAGRIGALPEGGAAQRVTARAQ